MEDRLLRPLSPPENLARDDSEAGQPSDPGQPGADFDVGGMAMVVMSRRFGVGEGNSRDPDVARAVREARDEHELLQNLMECASNGNQNCFEQLYDALVPRIYGLVQRILRNVAHAEEVTQEVFLEVWQKAPQYDSTRGAVGSWVTVIAHRRAVDRVRAAQSASERDMRMGGSRVRGSLRARGVDGSARSRQRLGACGFVQGS
jgi:hypothetical protein